MSTSPPGAAVTPKSYDGRNANNRPFKSVVISATLLATPSLSTFANKKPNNTEGGRRVYPPCTYGKLHDESCDHDKGEPAAGDAFDCISPCLLYTSDAADEEDSVDLG